MHQGIRNRPPASDSSTIADTRSFSRAATHTSYPPRQSRPSGWAQRRVAIVRMSCSQGTSRKIVSRQARSLHFLGVIGVNRGRNGTCRFLRRREGPDDDNSRKIDWANRVVNALGPCKGRKILRLGPKWRVSGKTPAQKWFSREVVAVLDAGECAGMVLAQCLCEYLDRMVVALPGFPPPASVGVNGGKVV
jgi:hypothetical protein